MSRAFPFDMATRLYSLYFLPSLATTVLLTMLYPCLRRLKILAPSLKQPKSRSASSGGDAFALHEVGKDFFLLRCVHAVSPFGCEAERYWETPRFEDSISSAIRPPRGTRPEPFSPCRARPLSPSQGIGRISGTKGGFRGFLPRFVGRFTSISISTSETWAAVFQQLDAGDHRLRDLDRAFTLPRFSRRRRSCCGPRR